MLSGYLTETSLGANEEQRIQAWLTRAWGGIEEASVKESGQAAPCHLSPALATWAVYAGEPRARTDRCPLDTSGLPT